MKGDWPHDIVRLLENWAMWIAAGKKGNSPQSCLKNIIPPGPRIGNVIPVFTGEAEEADKIICAMPERWQKALRMHYGWTLRSDRSRAEACLCSVNTYKQRVNQAHKLFSDAWYERV